MAEIANNITRIYPDGASPDSFIFQTDTEPPRFAIVDMSEDGYLGSSGPLSEAQLQIELDDAASEAFLTDEQREVYFGPNGIDYSISFAGEIGLNGNYPGGTERAAQNLARFVLGG